MKRLSSARKTLGNFLIAASLFAIAAVAAQPACATEKLRVGINLTTIETLPIYLAAEGNSAVELSGGAIPSVTEGKADAATNAETQAILRSTANPDIRVILTVAEYAYRIVARRSSGIAKAADLRGKEIATSLNSSAHFYIVKTLREAGLSESDVRVIGMSPPDMPAALARGEVDAVSIWEPAAQKSIDTLGADAMIINGPPYSERFNLNTSAAVIADPAKRAALVSFLRSIIAASREVSERPDRVQPLIAAKLNLSQEFVAKTWSLFRFPAAIGNDMLATMIEQEPWMAEKQNRASRRKEAIAALIDASLWQEASR
jgi:ABC-type nitrate/sulfonate/bicarbonate transport system substrate-binding protein